MAPCSCSPSLCRDCAGPARCARCGSGLSSSGSGTSAQALFQNVGVGTWESPTLMRENAVLLLEAYPVSATGNADVEVLDASPGAPLTTALDSNAIRTVAMRTKWPIRGVLPLIKVRLTVHSDTWSLWAGFVSQVPPDEQGIKVFSKPIVTTSPTLLFDPNPARKSVLLINTGINTVYLGTDQFVLPNSGFPLVSGASISDSDSADAWWGIVANGTSTMGLLETVSNSGEVQILRGLSL